jgi:CheY-like chemotaxis protein
VLNLNNSVSEIGATVREFLGEKIHFVINESPDLVHVLASPAHIEVIILNLVFNAREAMPTGGRLELSTANAVLDEQIDREYSEVVPGRYAMLSVSDTGTGMTPEVMDRIFEPFFTTKNLNFNRGFGLASLYGFVKQSGGHIDVSSTVGVGSTFRVYLPMYDGPLPTPSADIKAAPSHWTETILLVESNERVRQCTKVKLQQHGYKVLEASNAEDCLAMNRDYEGTIHLLLTELTLMQMNGRQLAKLVAESRPGVRVLFMSRYIEETLVHSDEESSGVEFLYVPFGLNTLHTKIRKVLDRL